MDRRIAPQSPPSPKAGVRRQLLDAALSLIREKGYSSTSVDELYVAVNAELRSLALREA